MARMLLKKGRKSRERAAGGQLGNKTMSVIDFIAVRRRQDNDSKSEDGPSFASEKGGKNQTPLTASQFTRHVNVDR